MPTVSWHKDGKQIKVCPKNLACPLEVKHAKYPVDDGNYICSATNTAGSDSAMLRILVLGKNV